MKESNKVYVKLKWKNIPWKAFGYLYENENKLIRGYSYYQKRKKKKG